MQPDENALRGRVRQVIKETGLTNIEFADDIELDADKLSSRSPVSAGSTSYELALISPSAAVPLLTGSNRRGARNDRCGRSSAGTERRFRSRRCHQPRREIADLHEIL